MSTKKRSSMAGNAWLLQRLTGVGLVILLGFHFLVAHFIVGAAEVSADGTRERLQTGLLDGTEHILGVEFSIPGLIYQTIAILLLAFSVYHGMYGVYNILMEQDFSARTNRLLKYFFTVLSIALFIQGVLIFQAFVGVI